MNIFFIFFVLMVLLAILPTMMHEEENFALSALQTGILTLSDTIEEKITDFLGFIEENEEKAEDKIGDFFKEDPLQQQLFHFKLAQSDDKNTDALEKKLILQKQWYKNEPLNPASLDALLSEHGLNFLRFNGRSVLVERFLNHGMLVMVQREKTGFWLGLLNIEYQKESPLDADVFTLFLMNDLGQGFGVLKEEKLPPSFLIEIADRLGEFQEDFGAKKWSFNYKNYLVVYKKLTWDGLVVVGWVEFWNVFRSARTLGIRLFFLMLGLILFFNAFLLKSIKKSNT